MTVAVSILPEQQLSVLNGSYRKAVARKRLQFTLATAVFFVVLFVAAVGAEVNLRTFFTYFGNFASYFDRIFTLEDGTRVWTNVGEWFWGWRKWLWMLGEGFAFEERVHGHQVFTPSTMFHRDSS